MVWDEVVRQNGQDVSPLLKPSALPAGLDTVRLLSGGHGRATFRVVYSGTGKRFEVSVGKLNPAFSKVAGASQQQVTVRGQRATVQVDAAGAVDAGASPTPHVWLTWREPGRWAIPALPNPEGAVEYFIFAHGVSAEEVLRTAESLRPA